MIHYWIQVQVLKSYNKHFHSFKPILAMKNFPVQPASFSLHIIIEHVFLYLHLSFFNILFNVLDVNIYGYHLLTIYHLINDYLFQ